MNNVYVLFLQNGPKKDTGTSKSY